MNLRRRRLMMVKDHLFHINLTLNENAAKGAVVYARLRVRGAASVN